MSEFADQTNGLASPAAKEGDPRLSPRILLLFLCTPISRTFSLRLVLLNALFPSNNITLQIRSAIFKYDGLLHSAYH